MREHRRAGQAQTADAGREPGARRIARGALASPGRQTPRSPPSENGQIAYSAGGAKVFVVSGGGDNPSNVTATLGATNDGPAYSPNGRKIAISSGVTGNRDIWLLNADGSNPVDLTVGNASADSDPTFSPDGRRIAYTSRQGGDDDVLVVNANGTGPVNLTSGSSTDDGSPDSRRRAADRLTRAARAVTTTCW